MRWAGSTIYRGPVARPEWGEHNGSSNPGHFFFIFKGKKRNIMRSCPSYRDRESWELYRHTWTCHALEPKGGVSMSRDTWKGSKRGGVHGVLVASLNRPRGGDQNHHRLTDRSIGRCAQWNLAERSRRGAWAGGECCFPLVLLLCPCRRISFKIRATYSLPRSKMYYNASVLSQIKFLGI